MHMGGTVDVYEVEGTQTHGSPSGDVTRYPAGPLPKTPLFSIPANRLLEAVNALLYVHRRTHEYEYEDVDWSEDERRAQEG